MKRYQDSNWVVKLWRRRHYIYIPFKFISYKLRGGDDFPNNKTLWGVLVGSAQCDMKWTYTMEEVKESIKPNQRGLENKVMDTKSWEGIKNSVYGKKGTERRDKLEEDVESFVERFESFKLGKEERHNMASCMLSILDSLKLYDTNSLELGDETLSEMMFRKMKGYDIDLNKELGFTHLKPIIKTKQK